MDHIVVVDVFESLGHVVPDFGYVTQGDRAFAEAIEEIDTGDKGHDQVPMGATRLIALDSRIEQADDAVVVEAGENGQLPSYRSTSNTTELKSFTATDRPSASSRPAASSDGTAM